MGEKAILIGLGEVGRVMAQLLGRVHPVVGVDVEQKVLPQPAGVLHICYPYHPIGGKDFLQVTADYIQRTEPGLVIIHSTVVPGTTRKVAARTGVPVVYSPVRGKHLHMEKDLCNYAKFVAGTDPNAVAKARRHLEEAGFKTDAMSSPETAELSKLLETTYFGLLIAWAQETERFCRREKVAYEEVVRFFEEVPFLPEGYTPGFIGGHCVMPNIELLSRVRRSGFLELIQQSNQQKSGEL